jgi:hypothetical protein
VEGEGEMGRKGGGNGEEREGGEGILFYHQIINHNDNSQNAERKEKWKIRERRSIPEI